jgi:hypothetical protein
MLGSSNVPTFRIITPGRVPGSSAIDEPHSGQKCRRIGLPLPPRLLNVLSVGLGGVAHSAAEAAAFDLHLDPLLSFPFGSRPNEW